MKLALSVSLLLVIGELYCILFIYNNVAEICVKFARNSRILTIFFRETSECEHSLSYNEL